MAEPTRRERARAAIQESREKARAGVQKARAGKRRAEGVVQEGREYVEEGRERVEGARERVEGTTTGEVAQRAAAAAKGALKEGDGQQAGPPAQGGRVPPRGARDVQQRPQGEVPPDNGAPADSMPTIEQFERTMVTGYGAVYDPMSRPGEEQRMPTPAEFEQEFFGGEDMGDMEAFERDFLRRL